MTEKREGIGKDSKSGDLGSTRNLGESQLNPREIMDIGYGRGIIRRSEGKEGEERYERALAKWQGIFDEQLKSLGELIGPVAQELAKIKTTPETDYLAKVTLALTGEKKGRNDSLNKIEDGDTGTERIQEIFLQRKDRKKKGEICTSSTVELVVSFLDNHPKKAAPWSDEQVSHFERVQCRIRFDTDAQGGLTRVGDINSGYHVIHPPKEGKRDKRGEDTLDQSTSKFLESTLEILRALQPKQEVR